MILLMYRKYKLYLVAGLVFLLLAHVPRVVGQTGLRDYAMSNGVRVGAAVAMTPFYNESPYVNALGREFNVIVAENAFKFSLIHTAPQTYNFVDADALVNYAEANGMKIRGHTLVWYNQLPSWVTNGSFTRDQAIALMREHIYTVAGRYRGRIWAWDVVNEALDGNGNLATNSFWQQKIGADYVKLAFQFTHEADPDALLYYNDYNIEDMSAKSNGAYNLVRDLQQQGVPVQGVGWQTHLVNGMRFNSSHEQNIQRLAALGLEVSITELDVRIQLPANAGNLATQAFAYGDVMRFCLAHSNCRAVVTWGFTDRYSWIPGVFAGFGAALPLDENYATKPAYASVLNELQTPLNQPAQAQFSARTYSATENSNRALIAVTRTGDTSAAGSVDYATAEGTARQPRHYTAASGVLRWAAGETAKTFSVSLTDNTYSEGPRTLWLELRRPQGTGLALGVPAQALLTINDDDTAPPSANPLETAQYFVNQHYADFLSRAPDAGGLAYWTGQITACGPDENCLRERRVAVSDAFFFEQEFQETGAFVYRLNLAAYAAPPTYLQFVADRARLPGGPDLPQSKAALAVEVTTRLSFLAHFPMTLTPAQYVDALDANAGLLLTPAQRAALINGLANGTETRGTVLAQMADLQALTERVYNQAFVLTQYFGYLRRDPDPGGYDFWLNILNLFPLRDTRGQHAMVCAFITSAEYQQRFSVLTPRSNQECPPA